MIILAENAETMLGKNTSITTQKKQMAITINFICMYM